MAPLRIPSLERSAVAPFRPHPPSLMGVVVVGFSCWVWVLVVLPFVVLGFWRRSVCWAVPDSWLALAEPLPHGARLIHALVYALVTLLFP